MTLTKQQALRVFKQFYSISKTDSIMNRLEWSYIRIHSVKMEG